MRAIALQIEQFVPEIFNIAGSRGISIDSKETGFLQRLKVLMQYFRKKTRFLHNFSIAATSFPPQMQLLGRVLTLMPIQLGSDSPEGKTRVKNRYCDCFVPRNDKKSVNASGLTRTARQHQLSSAVSISGVWKYDTKSYSRCKILILRYTTVNLSDILKYSLYHICDK